jgi:predicted transcriptional regulator
MFVTIFHKWIRAFNPCWCKLGSMPKKYRTKEEILAQILQIANSHGTHKTRLMYTVYLSYERLKEYLAILVQSGLIESIENTGSYRTTEKGLKFLKLLEDMEGELMTTPPHIPQLKNMH